MRSRLGSIGPLRPFFIRDLRNEVSYKLSFALQLFGVLPVLLMYFFLSKLFGSAIAGPLEPYGGTYFPFILIGAALQNYMAVALGGFSAGLRDAQLSGTLEAVFAAPVGVGQYLAGSTLYSFVFNLLRVVLYLAVGAVVFGAKLDWARFPLALLTLALTAAAFSSLGILSAAFVVVFKRGDPVNYFINVASWLLGGVYYPVSVLPGWVQKISAVIPMTHALEALRATLLGGAGIKEIGGHLAVLAAWAVVGLPIAVFLFKFSFERAQAKGTLGHY
ncbi:MAG: ABC transporter permease [Acidobacteriota bacterium]|nr:ABC transporter permease [Acidobacteriota bacterium]